MLNDLWSGSHESVGLSGASPGLRRGEQLLRDAETPSDSGAGGRRLSFTVGLLVEFSSPGSKLRDLALQLLHSGLKSG